LCASRVATKAAVSTPAFDRNVLADFFSFNRFADRAVHPATQNSTSGPPRLRGDVGPGKHLNYEVWNENPESFMKDQMSKAYRADFEKMIVDLKIERTPAWYSTIAEWKKA
jgi:hypothetical protein